MNTSGKIRIDRQEKRLCKYQFMDDEKRALAQDMANAVADMKALEDRLKAASTQIKAEISAKQGLINSSAEKLRSGWEMRDIICDVVLDFGFEEVRWVRTDNYETAFNRRMRPDEKQMALDEAPAPEGDEPQEEAADADADDQR